MRKVRRKMAVLLVLALVLTGLPIEACTCMTKAADQTKRYIWRGEVTGWGGPDSYPSSSNHVQGTGEDNFTESTDMTVYTASYGCGLELMNAYNPAFTGESCEMAEFIKGMKNPRIKVTLENGGSASVFNWDEELSFSSGKEMEIPEGYLDTGYFALFGNNDVITQVEIYDIGEKLQTPGMTETPEATDSGNQSIQNFNFNLLTIDDKEISTRSNGEKATILVFGRTTCPNTQTTISDLAKSELTESNELRVIYADIDQAAKGDVQEFASVYGNEYIDFCYRPSQTGYDTTISGMMWEYARVTGISSSVILPVTVLVDEKNQVQKVMTGVQKLQDILTEINNFAQLSYPDFGQTAEPGLKETPGGEVTGSPALNPSVNLTPFVYQTEGGQVSSNLSKHDYYSWRNWAEVVSSYLEQKTDGTYERVEACEGGVYIEQYSEDFKFVKSQKIELALPLFGGYFGGKKYNFLVFGQENPNEDDSLEVLRIVKYDKDWNELDSCSIGGINTTIPFRAGSLRMTETEDVLYIHTCHQMYRSDDGKNHQANMTFALNEQTMDATQKQYAVWNISIGYVSHSFNQFILTDGTYIYRLDHGDAYPRSIVMTKCRKDNILNCGDTTVMSIAGETGDNDTGVSVGGFALQGNRLVSVGNSVEQSGGSYNPYGQRNIFVAVTDIGLTGTSVRWLTDYEAEDSVSPGNPYLISCDNGYYVMWEEQDGDKNTLTKIVKIDTAGNPTGQTHTVYARLSDCMPVLTSDHRLVWYTTADSAPVFYCLETGKLGDYEYTGKGDVKDCVVTLSQDSFEYSSVTSSYEPIPTVKYGDVLLEEGKDYTVSYRNNHYVGTATVVIKGMGLFEGEKEVSFEIVNPEMPSLSESQMPSPSPKPSMSGQTLPPDGTTAPSNTVKPANTAKPGQKTTYSTNHNSVTVYPGRVSGVKAKNIAGKAVKITWKKARHADYYQTQIASNRAFTKGKKRSVSYSRSITFYRMKKNAMYYVRVRAVGYSNGRNRRGQWSAVKKVKILK